MQTLAAWAIRYLKRVVWWWWVVGPVRSGKLRLLFAFVFRSPPGRCVRGAARQAFFCGRRELQAAFEDDETDTGSAPALDTWEPVDRLPLSEIRAHRFPMGSSMSLLARRPLNPERDQGPQVSDGLIDEPVSP